MTHFGLDVTITSITSITSGFRPDVTLDGSLPGASPTPYAGGSCWLDREDREEGSRMANGE